MIVFPETSRVPIPPLPVEGAEYAVAGSALELLYESARTRIFRRRHPDLSRSLICKQPLGADPVGRLSRERAVLERLSSLDGVPRLVEDPTAPRACLVMEDAGGVSLAATLDGEPMAVPRLLELALELARIVAGLHRLGVVHRDINPANILLAPSGAMLIDFDFASPFAQERPGFTHHREIVGTLAYLAPEQSGRTGRVVDPRADLYALGVTLYELATGRLPFVGDDPLQLIRDHLARVPEPPQQRVPDLPPTLSEIILRLLEKEPDRRYQSAEGLIHDLTRLTEAMAQGGSLRFPVGERDFALRLSPPSRLLGRRLEIEALEQSLDAAIAGRGRGVLVAGVPGVGKTALIQELRPLVTARRGWFVMGKFDQYRRQDATTGAITQALRSFGRLLLAEPEGELAPQRERIRAALGLNAGLIAAVVPELESLLQPEPVAAPGDPVEGERRLRQAVLALLHATVSSARPLVMVIDDLQWAFQGSFGFLDAMSMEEGLPGFLLVVSYRKDDVDATHPIARMEERWTRLGRAPRRLELVNLPATDLGELIGEMLRLPAAEALRLAGALAARTGGNPYETIELLNALRRDEVLVPGSEGWSWDEAAIRRFVGRGEVGELLGARIAQLPAASRRLLAAMACLGNEMTFELLQVASGLTPAALAQDLRPALEDGLLVVDQGGHAAGLEGESRLGFRHDRVQQAAYDALSPADLGALHLELARRLAARPELASQAAGQYLPVMAGVHDTGERQAVVLLFYAAAQEARRASHHAGAERFLGAALTLLSDDELAGGEELTATLRSEQHAVLYSLGRLGEADTVYEEIARRSSDPLALVPAACVQIISLSHRGRQREALDLGFDLLARLGFGRPSDDVDAEVSRKLDGLYAWFSRVDLAADLERPEVDDPRLHAAGLLFGRMGAPAFFCDPRVAFWVVLECRRLWAEHGPCEELLGPLAFASLTTMALRQDHRTGYAVSRYVRSMGEARGYGEILFHARFLSLFTEHWFEPLAADLEKARLVRLSLLETGDLPSAGFTYHISVAAVCECAPTLAESAAEVEAALAFAARTADAHSQALFLSFRHLLRTLGGEPDPEGDGVDSASLSAYPMALAFFHITRAVAAALLDDRRALGFHAAATRPLLHFLEGHIHTAVAHFLLGLALAERVAGATAEEIQALLAELSASRDWLACRADDAPGNFAHLVLLVDAEREAARGDGQAAMARFEEALSEAEHRPYPWHRALIVERAARFHLRQGFEYTGRRLLSQARHLYEAWGAREKVRQLDRLYPFLRPASPPRPADRLHRSSGGSAVSADAIDLLAILRASQALSSETDLVRLQGRVAELLGALTGATAVSLALWSEEMGDWGLWMAPSSHGNSGSMPVEEAGAHGLLPLSALRYVERTGTPLLIEDAKRDDRFARDPYVAGLEHCSLLLVPVASQGLPRAILLLENRLSRGAFSTDRLDAVMLLSGQLAVSLDNALLYAGLERKVAERTTALAEANRRLEELSLTDPLTGLANRRRLAETLEAEWLRALRQKTPLGLAVIDIDQFKLYNDRYGHLAGDACLQRVAATLQEGLRRGSDLVARYGGEEFVLVLPAAGPEGVVQVAERLRAAIAELAEPHAGSSHGIVTVSIGITAFLPSAEDNAARHLQIADAALYEAKRLGRNRVCSADDITDS